MISHPILIILILLFVVFAVIFLSKNGQTQFFFKYLPTPLWCYFIPTLLSTTGLIQSDLPLYGNLSRFLLPVCLFLLLIGTHIQSIIRLSRQSLLAMLIGTVGIWIGGILTFIVLNKCGILNGIWTSQEILKGWGCLGATWTGGSMNLIAVKEILQTQESLLSNLIITDTVVAYSWMALLVFLSQYQNLIDSKLGPKITVNHEEEIEKKYDSETKNGKTTQIVNFFILITISFFFSYGCSFLSRFFLFLFNAFTWTVILATVIPLILSMTSARNLETMGASRIGNILLLFLLTTIGARANLTGLATAPFFILAGLSWALIHGLILILGGKIFKIPVSILATASQANIGGTVSAPIVATVYDKELASLGVILAVLGNIYGTYAGLFLAEICRHFLNLL